MPSRANRDDAKREFATAKTNADVRDLNAQVRDERRRLGEGRICDGVPQAEIAGDRHVVADPDGSALRHC